MPGTLCALVNIKSPTSPVTTTTKENQVILMTDIFMLWPVMTFWNFYLNKACCKYNLPYLCNLAYYKVASLYWPSILFTCSLVKLQLFLCWLTWIKTLYLNYPVRQLLFPHWTSNTFFEVAITHYLFLLHTSVLKSIDLYFVMHFVWLLHNTSILIHRSKTSTDLML